MKTAMHAHGFHYDPPSFPSFHETMKPFLEEYNDSDSDSDSNSDSDESDYGFNNYHDNDYNVINVGRSNRDDTIVSTNNTSGRVYTNTDTVTGDAQETDIIVTKEQEEINNDGSSSVVINANVNANANNKTAPINTDLTSQQPQHRRRRPREQRPLPTTTGADAVAAVSLSSSSTAFQAALLGGEGADDAASITADHQAALSIALRQEQDSRTTRQLAQRHDGLGQEPEQEGTTRTMVDGDTTDDFHRKELLRQTQQGTIEGAAVVSSSLAAERNMQYCIAEQRAEETRRLPIRLQELDDHRKRPWRRWCGRMTTTTTVPPRC